MDRDSQGAIVRPARIGEAAALSDLCARSKAAWGYDAAFMALARPALRVSQAQIKGGDVWVAIAADRQIVGVVGLGAGKQPGVIDLDKLFIEPHCMRRGLGGVLLANAIGEARRRGARRLTILADPYAAGFYEHHGAQLVGEAPSDAIPGRMLPLYEITLA